MKLSVININQDYDGKNILKNINFFVENKEFISIIGPSGCGKSTIFKIISGLEKNYTGRVEIDGVEISKYTGRLAYMPQNDLLLPWRRLYDNIKLPMEIEKTDKETINKKISEFLPEFKLSGEERKFPSELSGGMRKRAVLLRAFLVNSDIMLLDEPFGALDAITKTKMQDFLYEQYIKHNKTILFITHDIDEAIYLSDRILVLSSNPAEITDILKIEFEKPRNREIILTEKFLLYKKEIMSLL